MMFLVEVLKYWLYLIWLPVAIDVNGSRLRIVIAIIASKVQTLCEFSFLLIHGQCPVSGCGSVGRAVASDNRSPWFKTSHW